MALAQASLPSRRATQLAIASLQHLVEADFVSGRLADLATAAAAQGLELYQLPPRLMLTWGVAAAELQQGPAARTLLTHYMTALRDKGVPPSAADASALGRLVAVRLICQLLDKPQEAVQWVRAAPFLTTQQQQVLLKEVDACCAGPITTTATSMEDPALLATHPAGAGQATAATTPQTQTQPHLQQATALQPAPQQQQQQQQSCQPWQLQHVVGGDAVETEYCTFLGEPSDPDWAPSNAAAATAKEADSSGVSAAARAAAVGPEAAGIQQQDQQAPQLVDKQQQQQQQQVAGLQDVMHVGTAADVSGRSVWSVVADVRQQLASLPSKVYSHLAITTSPPPQQGTPVLQLAGWSAAAALVGYCAYRERRQLAAAGRHLSVALAATAGMALGLTPEPMAAIPHGRTGL